MAWSVVAMGLMAAPSLWAAPATDNLPSETWNGGGSLGWEINDATGTAGTDPGWDLVNITGSLTISATPASKFTIDLTSLTLANAAGPAANFDNAADFSWTLVKTTTGITGFDAAAIQLATSTFQNPLGTGIFVVELANAGNDLVIRFVHPPSITASPANAAAECGTGNATFTVAATGSAPLSYYWRQGGTVIPTSTTASLTINGATAANAGSYDVIVSNVFGVATSAAATLTVSDTVAPMITTCAPNQTIVATLAECKASLPDLTGLVSATDACPGAVTVTQSPAAGTAVGLGSTVVTLTAKDVAGNMSTCEATVTVNSGLTAGVNVSAPAICAGESVTLTATTSASSPAYQWSPGGATTASISVSPTATTVYTVTVTDGVTGCTVSANGTATVNPRPVVTVNSGTICVGDSMTLTATTGAASPSYQWSPGGQTTASISVSPATSTIYTVTVTDGVTSCSQAATSTVVVRQPDVFANTGSIAINDGAAGTPYPSLINVSGLTATVCKVTVTLNNLSHAYPDDIDLVLVGPAGQTVLLMSDVGGSHSISGLNLTFDDAAAAGLSDEGQIVSGTFKPTNIGAKSDGRADVLPAPVPVERYVTNLTSLNNIDPNGAWSLYVFDDELVDGGVIAGGWSVAITTMTPFADLAVAQAPVPNPVAVGSNLTFTVTVTNRGPAGAEQVVLTDALAGTFTFVSATASQGGCNQAAGTVTCNLGNVGPGAAATVTIVVTPGATGSISSSASIASSTLDLVTANNSAAASATVLLPPVITTQPVAQVTCEGGTIAFSVAATGAEPFSYQWYRNGAAIGGATAASYTVNSALPVHTGAYTVEVRNSVGAILSSAAAGTVNPTPSLTVPSTAICVGQSATLTASTSAGNPSYLWTPGGSTAASITVSPTATAVYTVSVTDGNTGCSNTTTATITVNPLTVASALSSFNNVCPGGSVTFSTTASGTPPLTYVWRKGGSLLPQTGSSITIASVAAADAGTYSVEVTGGCNSVTNSGTLTVVALPVITAQPVNQTTPMGNGVVFSATATGQSLAYQWQLNGTDISGATASSLAISNLTLSASGGQYRVGVSNCAGTVFSSVATLTVTPIAGLSFDFETSDQFTNVPYAMIYNDWLIASPTTGLVLPAPTFYSPTGGVGVATGGGALDLLNGNAQENTIIALPISYDFSLVGKRLTASTMFKAKAPANNNRSTQIGFLTATNQGVNDNNPQAFMTVILQSTAQPALTYELRHQRRNSNGGIQESTFPGTATLTAGNWYKVTATFVNTKDLSASNFTSIGSLQDMGPQGTTPGAVLLSFTATTNSADIVNSKNVYLGMRGFENTGVDFRDNIYANTGTGPIAFVAQPGNQTVLQGRRAVLRALVDGDGPYTYQWSRNGSPISGARSWKYVLPPATLSESGAQYTVTVTGPANTVTSDPAVITVQAETLSVVSAGSVDGSSVGVRFSQPVDVASASNPANYLINGVAPAVAQVYQSLTEVGQAGGEGMRVLLTPASVIAGAFTVTVQAVKDLSGNPVGANNSVSGTVAGLIGEDVNPYAAQPVGRNVSFAPGQFEVAGGGADIFGVADSFRYVYTRKTGDFDVKVRVPFLDVVRTPTKGAIDARASLDPFSPHVCAAVNPRFPGRNFSEGVARPSYNTATVSWGNNTTTAGYPDVWVRLRRVGNTFLRYLSSNGTTWTYDGQTLQPAMPDTVYLGLAVCSVAQGNYATAQFESYGDFAGYAGATIAISQQPVASTNIAAGGSATLVVVASATGGSIPSAPGELTYTWQRSNGAGGWTNVPFAVSTNGILNTGTLYISDSGAQYRAIVSAPGATSVTSGTSAVTVADATAPTLTGGSIPPGSVNQVIVTFSEAMGASAAVAGNYAVTNGAGASMGVASVVFLGLDPRVVVVTTTTAMETGTYGVSVTGVQDLAGNTIVSPAVRTFASQGGNSPLAVGPVVAEFYGSLTNAGNITDLIASARTKFGTPDFVVYSNVFGIHPVNAGFPNQGFGDNYGVRMFTYFVPPTTGAYKFYTRADDFAQFLMNTNATGSTNPAGAVVQVTMPINVPTYQLTNSVTNFLSAGQKYYMEFRYKETGGGDGGTVAVRTDNTVPGQGEVIAASTLAYPDAIAQPTPVVIELYTGLAQTQNANVGGLSDFMVATNLPRFIATIPNVMGYAGYFGYNTNFVQINGTFDSYLGRAVSYFVPPSNGLYRIWFRTDDSGQVLMNTNEVNSTDPAGARLIGGLQYFTNANYAMVGEKVSLKGGQRYYMEARWREGTGGDGFSVTFRAQSDQNTPPVTEVANATYFSTPTNLARLGPPSIAGIAPATVNVKHGTAVQFNAVGVNGAFTALGINTVGAAFPGYITWLKNGVPIFANSEVFTNVLTSADNGAVISCVVSNIMGVAVASTTVTVQSDTTAPALVSALGNQYYDTVVVTFSEPVDLASASAPGNYRITGLTIFGATFDYGQRTRVSLRTSPHTPGASYSVVVNDVKDVAGNSIASNSSAPFRGWAPGGGNALLVELYTNIPGTAVDNLVKDSKYLNNFPDVAFYTNKFGVGQFATSTGLDNYGARVSGYFMPPSNGLYRFYIRGDDGTQLFMNTNGSSSLDRTMIARNDGANSGTYENGTGNGIVGASISPILTLNAGTAYYTEGFLKEGGGGDHMELVFRAIDPSTLAPTVALPATPAVLDIAPATFFSAPGNPSGVQIALTTALPAETSVAVNDLINLDGTASVTPFSLTPFLGYQWQRFDSGSSSFVNIPGANRPVLTFSAKAADNGVAYRVIASVPGGSVTATTTVRVVADTVGPRIVSAISLDGKTIGVCFSEPVEPSSAGDEFSYVVNSGANLVVDATARADGMSALLILDAPITGTFTVEPTGVFGLTDGAQLFPGTGSFTGKVKNYIAMDVGAPAAAGSSFSCREGEIEVIAGGADIWANSDQGHLTLTPRSGDFDIHVRIESLLRTSADTITKAGLMIRETLEPGSRTLHALVNPALWDGGRDQAEGGARMAAAGTTAAWSYNTNLAVATGNEPSIPNAWIRLTRQGNTYRAYGSRDGVNWTTFATTHNTFSNTVYVGLATTAHNNAAPPTLAKYRDVYIPEVPSILTQPTPASKTVALHSSVSYTVVVANPPNSGTLRYRWRRDGVAIDNATSATLTIANAGAGDSGVYTVDVGNDGGETTSIPVTLTVNNLAPIVVADTVTATSSALAIPAATLLGNDTDPEGDALSIAAVSGIRPVTVGTNFNEGLLEGSTVYGTASFDLSGVGVDGSGALRLTSAAGNQSGGYVTAELAPQKRVSSFNANFKLRISEGGPNEAADGFSFNFGRDLTLGTAAAAEEGAGTGLSFCVDNYRAPGDARAYTSALKLKYGGFQVAFVQSSTWNINRQVPVSVALAADGRVTVLVDGTNVFGEITVPYVPITGRFGFYGRTGGAFEATFVDDLSITVMTTDTGRNYDFAGASIYGNAYLDPTTGVGSSGALHLTDNVINQAGSLVIPELTPGSPVESFNASFKLRIGNGSGNAADGFSFNLAADLPNAAAGGATAAEEGIGTGLSITVDNYPTGGADSPSFKLKLGGTLLGFIKIPKWNSANYVPISLNLDANGLDVVVDGTNVVNNLAIPYVPIAGRFGLFARTGGENETHWIDDLVINVTTPGHLATYANNFDAGGPGAVSLAGSVVTYNRPANSCGIDRFYYLASDGQTGGITVGEVRVTLPEAIPQAPVIVTCATNRTYTSATPVALPDLTGEVVATDNCYALVTQSPIPGTILPFGATVVTFTATDVAGLTATCQATITVINPTPPVIVSVGFAGGNFTGSFGTSPGSTYRVEFKNLFSDPEWTLLTTIVGDGTTKTFTDPGPVQPTRFYRVTVQ